MHEFRQQKIRRNLAVRAEVLKAVRAFFAARDFLEVETPIRIFAPAPEPHIDAFASQDAWLQTSPELYMKRLLAAGCKRIFQICKTFRAGERGRLHLPEFTMLEFYEAGSDYRDAMALTRDLIRFVCRQVTGEKHLDYQGARIEIFSPWQQITVEEAFARHAGKEMPEALADGTFDEIISADIEPGIERSRPAFLFDYPAEKGALARLRPDRPELAERFEAYIGGLEICNGFTELTDPEEQRLRFETEQNRRRKKGLPIYPLPESFLEALSSMPPSAGNALGMDRLVMLFAGADTIDQVTAFVPEEY